MYSYGKTQYEKNFTKNTVYRLYTKIYENSRIKGWKIQQNCYEISEKLVRYFFYSLI